MNFIFKVVFNQSTLTYNVVSELAKGKVKSSRSNQLFSQHESSNQSRINQLFKYSLLSLPLFLFSGINNTAHAATGNLFCTKPDGGVYTNSQTSLNDTVLCGDGAKVGSPASIAIGKSAEATSTDSSSSTSAVAIGYEATAKGQQAVALGSRAKAIANQSVAMGNDTFASGYGAFSLGGDDTETSGGYGDSDLNKGYHRPSTLARYRQSAAVGVGSIVVGVHAQALSNGSTALGVGALAGNGTVVNSSTNLTDFVVTNNIQATAIGALSNASHQRSTAIGYLAKALEQNATALGSEALANKQNAIAIGSKAKAQVSSGIALGDGATIVADNDGIYYGQIEKVKQTGESKESIAIGKGANIGKGSPNAIAIGTGAKVNYSTTGSAFQDTAGSLAIGYNAEVNVGTSYTNDSFKHGTFGGATAIGHNAKTANGAAVALGSARANAINSIAIGAYGNTSVGNYYAETRSDGSFAVGNQAIVDTNAAGAQAIGRGAIIIKDSAGAVALGQSAVAQGLGAVAIGGSSSQTVDANLPRGNSAMAGAKYSLALSADSRVSQGSEAGIAIGYGARVGEGELTQDSVTQIPTGVTGTKIAANAIAIGRGAKALAERAISVGTGNIVTGVASGAFGDPSIINGANSYVLGNDNAIGSTTSGAVAIGNQNQLGAVATYDSNGKLQITTPLADESNASNSIAVGNKNYINTQNTYVLGSGINVKNDGTTLIGSTVANSVYLGSDSQATAGTDVGKKNTDKEGVEGTTTTAGDKGTVENVALNGMTFGKFAGATANGVVTVGAVGSERRIQNVAAGEISATSTDAINGSQLYAVTKTLGDQVANTYFHVRKGDAALTGDATENKGLITDTAGATGTNALAAGIKAKAQGNESVAVGYQASTSENALESLAFGIGAKAKAVSSTAIGTKSEAIGRSSLAIGGGSGTTITKAEGDSSMALGYGSTTASGASWSQAIGDLASVGEGAIYSMALGANTTVQKSAIYSMALGPYAVINEGAAKSTVIGAYAMSNAVEGTAIGNGAVVYSEGGLALGSGSWANRNMGKTGYDPLTKETSSITDTTWQATHSAVSVGRAQSGSFDTITRQITNVAAGSEDTDAVNVAQLKAAGLKFAGNTDSITVDKKLGETLTIKGGLDNSSEATDKNTRVDVEGGNMIVKMAKTLTNLTSATFGTGDSLVKVDSTGLQFVNATGGKIDNTPSITKDGIDAGNQQITHVKSGGNVDTNAANIGDITRIAQSEELTSSVTAGAGVEVSSSQSGNNTAYAVALNSTTLASLAKADSALQDVNITSKNNSISVTPNKKGTTQSFNIEVNAQGVVETAQIPVVYTDSDGEKLYKQADGSFNTNPDGTGVSVDPVNVITSMQNASGGTTLPITLTNIKGNLPAVTATTNAQTAPIFTAQQLNNAATLGDVLNAGWNLQGNGIAKDFVKPYDTVNFINGNATTAVVETAAGTSSTVKYDVAVDGTTIKVVDGKLTAAADTNTVTTVTEGDNITVTSTTDASGNPTYTVATKKDVNFDSVTVGSVVIDKDGINAGDTKITNVKDGDITADSKDAVNGSQLYAVKNELNTSIAAAKTVVESTDKSVGITSSTNAAGATVYDLSVNTDGTTIKKDTNGALTVNTTPLTNNVDGTVNTPANPNAIATAGDVANAINNSGFNLTAQGSNGSLVKPGATVDMNNTDGNIVISKSASDNNVTYNLAKDINVNSVTAGNTVVNNAGVTINNADPAKTVSITETGLNNGGNTITNVAAGVNDTDVVNVGQLKAANQKINNNFAHLDGKINQVDRDLRGGVASAVATAGLPQAFLPGKSMVAMAAATYRGQSSLAVGVSRVSDNGKIVIKATGTTNTRGDVSASIGAGYQW